MVANPRFLCVNPAHLVPELLILSLNYDVLVLKKIGRQFNRIKVNETVPTPVFKHILTQTQLF